MFSLVNACFYSMKFVRVRLFLIPLSVSAVIPFSWPFQELLQRTCSVTRNKLKLE